MTSPKDVDAHGSSRERIAASAPMRAAQRLAVLSALLCAGLPLRVRAEAAPAAVQTHAQRENDAEVHFDRGLELYREGDPDAALVEFERAYALVPNFRLLYNMAQIQVERHQYTAAKELFEAYLEQGGETLPEPRRQAVEQELLKLQERIARLWVETDVEGARLYIDDRFVSELPLSEPMLINSGICRLRVEKKGYRSVGTELKVVGGDAPRVRLVLGEPLASSRARGRPSPEPEVVRSYAPLWISAGSTVALAGAAVTFGLMARTLNRQLDRELERVPVAAAELEVLRPKLKLYAALTDGFAAGSVLAALVAVYFASAPPERPLLKAGAATIKSLRVLPESRGLTLRGAF